MIEQIKNPLYPDFSDREIVAIEDDYTIRFTDEELEKAVRYLAEGHSIYSQHGMLIFLRMGEYLEKLPEYLPSREGYIPEILCTAIPVVDIDGKRKVSTFEISLCWKRKDSIDNPELLK